MVIFLVVAAIVAGDGGPGQRPLFYVLRTILKSASYMVDVAEAVRKLVPELEVVDPYTLGLLVRCHEGVLDCSG